MPIKELCVLKNQSYLNLSQKKGHYFVLVIVILKLNVLIKPKMCIHVTEVLKQCNSIAYLSSFCLFHFFLIFLAIRSLIAMMRREGVIPCLFLLPPTPPPTPPPPPFLLLCVLHLLTPPPARRPIAWPCLMSLCKYKYNDEPDVFNRFIRFSDCF